MKAKDGELQDLEDLINHKDSLIQQMHVNLSEIED